MNNSGNAGFAHDYALLRATPGCDLEELKRRYRLAVRELHPDRNPELAADTAAQDALSELTTAYRRLLDYHRAYGRLPGEHLRRQAAPAAESGATPLPPAQRSPFRRWAAFVLVAGAGLYWLWPAADEAPAQPAPQLQPPPAAGSAAEVDARGFKDPYASAAPPVQRRVRIGDTKLKVRSILGAPIFGNAEVWEYGPSHVRFRDGRVIDWYDSPLKPIAVDESSRKTAVEGAPPAD